MATLKKVITWTLKVDESLDRAVQKAVKLLGFTGKAELTREAVREYLIRQKLISLLEGEITVPLNPQKNPEHALKNLLEMLGNIPDNVLKEEVRIARDEVEKELLE
jgi:hypothetical protein